LGSKKGKTLKRTGQYTGRLRFLYFNLFRYAQNGCGVHKPQALLKSGYADYPVKAGWTRENYYAKRRA
jgi:hypothetical protein